MLTWKQVNGAWYCYKNGTLVKGWIQDTDKRWYYLNPADGKMATGWVQVDSKWYYLYPQKTEKDGNTHYRGEMAIGWLQIGSAWYFLFTQKTTNYGIEYPIGAMAIDWLELNNKWYYFLKQQTTYNGYNHYVGEMVASTTMTINNNSYTFDSNGAMQNNSGLYSDKLVEFTKSWEGFVESWDKSSSYGAIGYGTDASGTVGTRLKAQGVTSCTQAQATEWLKEELNDWASNVKKRCDNKGVQLNQYCFDCMIDICYQWGNQQWGIFDLLASGNIADAKAKIKALGYARRDNARCNMLDGQYTLNS